MGGRANVTKAETMTRQIINKCFLAAVVLLVASSAVAQNSDSASRMAERDLREIKRILPGVYTNEEQIYFQTSLGLPEADHVARSELIIKRTGDSFTSTLRWSDGRSIDARHDYRVYDGKIVANAFRNGRADCSRTITHEFDSFRGVGCGGTMVVSPEGFHLSIDGVTYKMLRARTFKCWASPRKKDGSYAFYNDLVLHDQGGRVWIEATDEHPRVGLKLRNVQWPTGVNRDSMVLYTYLGDDAEYSPAYVWSDPESERLAINTRWLQTSCTQGDATITPNINLNVALAE